MFAYVAYHVGKREFVFSMNSREDLILMSLEFLIAGWHSLDAVGTSFGGGFEISMKLGKIVHW